VRENRTHGSEGGEGFALPDPYQQQLEHKESMIQSQREKLAAQGTLIDIQQKELAARETDHPLPEGPTRLEPCNPVYSRLRLFSKWVLPACFQRGFRHARQRMRSQEGNDSGLELRQYPPVEMKIPDHYKRITALSKDGLPVISMVTPSCNQARFIERTVKSVLEQDYPRLEYLIQDCGSEDGTRKILEKYGSKLTHVESCEDTGQANAINLGFAHSTGEIMAWINSDDMLLPGTLSYVAEFFIKHPDVDLVYGHRIVIDEDDYEIGRWVLPPHDKYSYLWMDYVPQETVFWRRRLWKQTGGYIDEDYQFCIDWELLLRFQKAGAKIVRLPRFLGAFRIHDKQKSLCWWEHIGKQEVIRLRATYGAQLTWGQMIQYYKKSYKTRARWFRRLYDLKILRY